MPRELRSAALSQQAVRFSNGTRIEVPSFAGQLTQWTAGRGGLRAARRPAERDLPPGIEDALEEVGLRAQETIHLEVQAQAPGVRAMTRRGAELDRVVLKPAPPAQDGVQLVWYQDESGGHSWHFPDGFLVAAGERARHPDRDRARAGVLRAARGATFTIPTRTPAAQRALASGQPAERLRGPVVKLGRKIFRVLVIPLSKLIARPLETIVGKVEKKYRQELVRPLTLANYRQLVDQPFTDWAALDGKRSLLVVHGIFSTCHGMLSGLPPAAMERLLAHYEGRVIGFDQLTVTLSPEENAADFLRRLREARPNGRFDFDILCHSRGGVVSRTLAERGQVLQPGHPGRFDKVFFVAAPNAGSPLGDAGHMVDMIDLFTNLFTNFPDGPVLYSFEVLLAILKLLAYAAGTELPGIRDMGTDGYIRRVLNASGLAPAGLSYAAAAANYEPKPRDNGWLNGRLADSVIDLVFGKTANDLVVPRDGVFAPNGHPLFPIADPLVFGDDDHVSHTEFFAQPRTIAAICRHFGIDGGDAFVVEPAPAVEAPPAAEPSVDEPVIDLDEVEAAMVGSLLGEDGGGRTGGGETWSLSRGELSETSGRRRPSRPRLTRSEGGRRPTPRPSSTRRPRRPAAEAPPSAPVASEGARLERTPQIDFHEAVEEGVAQDLVVRLEELVAGSPIAALAIELAAGETSATLDVRLHAPGFDVKPAKALPMTVQRERDPQRERVTFSLKARKPGKAPKRREITAEFWLKNAVIGTVTHATVVLPKGHSGPLAGSGLGSGSAPPAASFELPRIRREDCDWALTIAGRDEAGQPPFRLQLRSEVPGEEIAALDCGLFNLPQKDLGAYLATALDSLITQYPSDNGQSAAQLAREVAAWNQAFLARLNDLGKQLWSFLPPRFRDEYWRFSEAGLAPRSILVHSDEMLFPWELVVPNDPRSGRFVELDALGVSHVLGRWKPQLRMRPSPQRLEVASFVVLNPVYPEPDRLPWAKSEAKAIVKLFPRAEVYRPATAAHITSDLLRRDSVRLLHFSGHGEHDPQNADLSRLLLEDGSQLDALTLARTRLGFEASPIAYLNACSVGSSGITVGRAGGFAAACLDGGFSGVIAPYWPVNDESAAHFALALYRKLNGGLAIGEALTELKGEHLDDPTYLAFAYFGDPWARLSFAPLVA